VPRRTALALTLTLLGAACSSSTPSRPVTPTPPLAAPTSMETPAQGEGARVVAVTLVCRYVTREGDNAVTREGEGPFCSPASPHTVGSVTVRRVLDVRALLTIRSPERDDYIVESRNTDVRVGDPWPLPER
jgi:hypothetical protein